jgi:glycosyltransferase involved in cell wall biosynthesis
MKIMWSSNAPWSTSGYGQQTAMFVPRLQALGHEVAISCFFGLEGGCIEWNGIRCYPTDASRFGNHRLGEYVQHHAEGDRDNCLVITLQDVWCLLAGVQNFKDIRFASWCPVDHDPIPPMVLDFLRAVDAKTIAMTRFGQKRFEEEGIEAMYVPHGVPTDVFLPQPEMRSQYRQGLGIPDDAFVVGMVAMNQGLPPRKCFPQVFQAFKTFHDAHPEAVLYLHSEVMGINNGVNLPELARQVGVPDNALRTSDQLSLHLGIPQAMMNGVYNTFDVLALPSMGEGFGIPLIEAQATGCPVITTDWTSMTELCGAGWLVDGEKWYDATQRSFYKNPTVGGIYAALESAYDGARDWELREKAREFALGYDVDTVMDEHWVPVMDELEKVERVPPLRLAA